MFKNLPKWWNFARSGHTDSISVFKVKYLKHLKGKTVRFVSKAFLLCSSHSVTRKNRQISIKFAQK